MGFYLQKIFRNFRNFIKNLKEYFTKFKADFFKQRLDQIVGIIPQHFDLVILGYFTDFSTVGIFRIAKRLVEPINYVISVLTPMFKINFQKKFDINFKDLVKKFLTTSFICSLLFTCILVKI